MNLFKRFLKFLGFQDGGIAPGYKTLKEIPIKPLFTEFIGNYIEGKPEYICISGSHVSLNIGDIITIKQGSFKVTEQNKYLCRATRIT